MLNLEFGHFYRRCQLKLLMMLLLQQYFGLVSQMEQVFQLILMCLPILNLLANLWKQVCESIYSVLTRLDPQVRKQFVSLMTSASHQSFHLIPVFAKLAQYHSESIAALIVHELFLIAFVNKDTRDAFHRQTITYIGQIVSDHPQMVCNIVLL